MRKLDGDGPYGSKKNDLTKQGRVLFSHTYIFA